eukprot:scaffold696_cov163-Ochromonas_danica.AAC.5
MVPSNVHLRHDHHLTTRQLWGIIGSFAISVIRISGVWKEGISNSLEASGGDAGRAAACSQPAVGPSLHLHSLLPSQPKEDPTDPINRHQAIALLL